jgi:adenosylmethionine-8-amino-7-oxononanoate aminotransferase
VSPLRPESRREGLVARDKRYVWHPYTPMAAYIQDTDPFVIDSAQGSRLYDADGRSYLDGNASWWTAVLGHGHPRIVAALAEQASRLCHTSMAGVTHEQGALLAEELIHMAPRGLSRVFYSDDGSTAVEVALKLAAQYWVNRGVPGRRRFVALSGAFHGDTLGAMSVGGVEVFRRPFADLLVDCIHVPPPEGLGDRQSHALAFAALEEVLRADHRSIAALVLEPRVQGAAGMRMYDAEYLARVRALTEELGVLLVVDEVFTGYGRTGPLWAWDAPTAPDLVCLGKGFTAGTLPMAATLASEEIFEAFLGAPERAFFHGHTFCGNPLGARIAREVFAIYREEQVLERAVPKARRIAEVFSAMAAIPGVARARSLGMIGALDLAGDPSYLASRGKRVCLEARRLGAYLRPLGDVVYITPPINISDVDLDELLAIVSESVRVALATE